MIRSHDVFEITTPDGDVTEMAPTQETLDELGVTGNLNKFLDGSISKPIAVPGTYQKVEQQPQGVFKILLAAIKGVYDTIDIILFVFILGGCIGVLNYMGAFNAAIAALSKVTKGKEYILIILITIIIAAGGTTFGLAEETIALYPILVPVFLAAGYDVMVCIAAIYMGSSIGTMFPTINPFSVGNASNAAGISLADGMGIRGQPNRAERFSEKKFRYLKTKRFPTSRTTVTIRISLLCAVLRSISRPPQ